MGERVSYTVGGVRADEGEPVAPALRAAGVEPGSIDGVLMSHLHFDHAGGLLLADGRRAFPRARIVAQRAEWEIALDENSRIVASYDQPELRLVAEEKGRGDVDFKIATEVYVCVGRPSREARDNSARTLGVLPEGFADDATPAAIEESGLIGSAAEVSEKLRSYVAAGVQHYEMKFIYQSVEHLLEQLEMFSTDVIPNVK